MIASREVEIPFFRGVGQQRGRGVVALAQVIGRSATPFLRKYIVPAAKRMSAELLEFAAMEIAEVVDRKSFKTATKSVGRQTLRKQLGSDSKKGTASRVIPTKAAKHISRSRGDSLCKHFSIIMPNNFGYQPFVAVSGNLGGKLPVVDDILSSHEQEIYPTTSLDENCIEFNFQTDKNFYVELKQTYMALKLKFVRGRGYQIYNSKEVKKEHKTEAKAEEEETAEEASVPFVTNVIFALNFVPVLKCISTISKFTTVVDCMLTNLTFPITSREPSLLTFHFTHVVLLSNMTITRNEWICLPTFLWRSTVWKL